MKKTNAKSLLLLAGFVAVIFAANLVTGCSKNQREDDCYAKFQQGFAQALFLLNPNSPNFAI